MRKSEMTQEQIDDRNSFLDLLVAASWDPRGWEILFDADQSLAPEGQAEFQNDSFNLRLSYFVADEYVLLEAVARIGDLALTLRLYPAGRLDDVVDVIVAWQVRLTDENWTEFVESLKPLCRLIVLETADDLIEIS